MSTQLKPVLKSVTASRFDGGQNSIQYDLNIDSRYAKRLWNMIIGPDGTPQVRFGTKLFANCSAHLDTIVALAYFGNIIVAVGMNGKLCAIHANGSVDLIWDNAIAVASGANAGWGTTSFVSYDTFNGVLVLCNGLNKPLRIDSQGSHLNPSGYTCKYLVDEATGSNIFVPTARYVRAHARYLLMAGDLLDPSILYIGSQDTIGTFEGAPAPNNGVNVDLGTRVTGGDNAITGIASFRGKVLAMFQGCIVPGTIATSGATTTASFDDDVIGSFGTIAHNSIVDLGDDLFFMDTNGVSVISRTLLAGILTPAKLSLLIDPDVNSILSQLDLAAAADEVFAVHDKIESVVYFVVPNVSLNDGGTETLVFAGKYPGLRTATRDIAWSIMRDWRWRCGCRSSLGKLFFSGGDKVYQYGSQVDLFYADRMLQEETFSDGTVFLDRHGFNPVVAGTNGGVPVFFDWVWPWSALKQRDYSKLSRHIKVDAPGTGRFTLQMFIDNIFNDTDDPGEPFSDNTTFTDDSGFERELLNPAMSMNFVGGDTRGFGLQGYGTDEFGGGRLASEERQYAWINKFKLFRLRFFGSVTSPLKFSSVTMNYILANIHR